MGALGRNGGRVPALPRNFRWLLVLALALFFALPAAADTGAERAVKAAYLYKFAAYVEWPPGAFAYADSPVVIGVVGAAPLAAELESLVAGQQLKGRRFAVRRLRASDPPAGVHILFIGAINPRQAAEILAATRGQPILTVTDSSTAHAWGSMINFTVTDQRLRFEVALKPVAASRLRLSALMLTAAHRVARDAP